MKNRFKSIVQLITFVLIALFIIALGIPLIHDLIFDIYSVSNYKEKEGIVSDVILKNNNPKVCENIIVDDYNIFVKCGDYYKQQFNIGDKTTYYVYKDKAYHTKNQMKSGTLIGKIIDYGMIGSYVLILFLIFHNKSKFNTWVDEITGNKSNL